MPIRPDLRRFYRGPKWQAVRERILARAGNKCEQCSKPDRTLVFTICTGKAMYWSVASVRSTRWYNQRGQVMPRAFWWVLRPTTKPRMIHVILTVAHLNHVSGDDRDENLRALCQWCHLHHDKDHHRETQTERKDLARPLLQLTQVPVEV